MGRWPCVLGKEEEHEKQGKQDQQHAININSNKDCQGFGHPVWTQLEELNGKIVVDQAYGPPFKHFTDNKIIANWLCGQAEVFGNDRRADVEDMGEVLEDHRPALLSHTQSILLGG